MNKCTNCGFEPKIGHLGIRTVVADPPWPHTMAGGNAHKDGKGRTHPVDHYGLLSMEELYNMKPITHRRAHLYLWSLPQHLDWAYDLARAWGFEPLQQFTWNKPLGSGRFQSNTEPIIVCRKGGTAKNAFGMSGGTHFNWPKPRAHSKKPQEMYDLVKKISLGDYLEMFARGERPGWEVWGDEAKV